MPKPTWEVTVNVEAKHVLTIGSDHLAGVENIDDHADTILTCAQHLVSFIGGETEREKFFREEAERTARNRDMWKGQCERQAEQLAALRALIREALAALEPFANEAKSWHQFDDDDPLVDGLHEAPISFVSVGDLRRTRLLHDKIKKELPDA